MKKNCFLRWKYYSRRSIANTGRCDKKELNIFLSERAFKLRRTINKMDADIDIGENELYRKGWGVLAQVQQLLETFAVITTYIEGNQYPTLSLVVPLMMMMRC
jgi:predicted glycosyltransferase